MNSNTENYTDYELTKKEEAIIEALMDPRNRTKTIEQVCKIANCCPKTYHNAFKKPGFVERYNEASMLLVKAAVGPVINAYKREASRGSSAHGNVLLEMAGLYNKKQTIEHTGASPVTFVNNIPDDEDE